MKLLKKGTMRNVYELVDALNNLNFDDDNKYLLDGNMVVCINKVGSRLPIVKFTKDKESLILEDFNKMGSIAKDYIYFFLLDSIKDDWFKEFGIREFEELCRKINEIFRNQYFFTLYNNDKVSINAPSISSDASFIFHKDGSIGFYGITKVEVLDILHDFIKNNDIKKIFRENVDFMEAQ